MAVERTLSIIKPDATRRNLTGAIVDRFEKAGLRVMASRRMRLRLRRPKPSMACMPRAPSSAAWSIS